MDNVKLEPKLVENHVKYILSNTLAQCHYYKEHYFNNLLNIGLGIMMVIIVYIYVKLNYKGPVSQEVLKHQAYEKNLKVLDQIHAYDSTQKQLDNLCPLTGLHFNMELF